MENEAASRELLTEAHGIVEKEKLGDWIGHVTCRIPPGDRILIKPQWVRLGGLRPEDFLVIDLEGKVLDWGAGDPARKGFNPPSEWPLHTEIYLAREDVQAVAHTHPLVATAMTVAGVDIEPLYHRSAYFGAGVPLYPKPDLINTQALGIETAQALGGHNALLLQGHGAITVGAEVEESVILAIFLEQSAWTQWVAQSFGKPLRNLPDDFTAPYVGLQPNRFPFVWDFFKAIHL
ncbi:MAG: class II aldolase/adducin family protein [Nitrospinota bacterium]|jgi:L-fuculose-phosphate aldolase|nr:class II aldolase/adducin family protein [Nitrospinota bacterium]MDP7386732.1 class II aldolase/adducin family protein [Nitrospinota bacterium]